MNRDQLRKNIGKKFRFFPIPTRNTANGSYETDKNLWLLRSEVADQNGFEFLNLFGDYNSLILDPLKIKNFDEPDKWILRGQVILDGSTVRYEPFTEQPASDGGPKTCLVFSLAGLNPGDIGHICHDNKSHLAPLQFAVTNTGEQTVRDYRVEVFVPKTMHYFYGAHPGSLMAESSADIERAIYTVYRRSVLEPIYKNDIRPIGEMKP